MVSVLGFLMTPPPPPPAERLPSAMTVSVRKRTHFHCQARPLPAPPLRGTGPRGPGQEPVASANKNHICKQEGENQTAT